MPTLTGTDGDDILHGSQYDAVEALGGNDTVYVNLDDFPPQTVNGGTGVDTLYLLQEDWGRPSDPWYYNYPFSEDPTDGSYFNSGAGVDFTGIEILRLSTPISVGSYEYVWSSVTYTVAGAWVLRLTGISDIDGTGGTVHGNSGNNILEGTHLFGEAGNDTLHGAPNGRLDGGSGDDALYGGATLLGGMGVDGLYGGDGGQRYIFNSGAEHTSAEIFDSGISGRDEVAFSPAAEGETFTFFAGENGIERVSMAGTSAFNVAANINARVLTAGLEIFGNDSANIIQATDFVDLLVGRGGDDTLSGFGGNDTILGGFGADTMSGGDGDDSLSGESDADFLNAGDGNDALNGGAGADTLIGGVGNDSYQVDDLGDQVIEDSAAGTDTVSSSVSFTLGANIEYLSLSGSAAINGYGNDLNNRLLGNSAANFLSGGAGADIMSGYGGNDIYVVDNTGDTVAETSTGGIDLVRSSLSFTLGANIENLTLTGSATHGTGNGLANVITGNGGANVLNGGAGADTLQGGAGSDTYFVDNVGDQVIDSSYAGTDTVNSSVSYTLGAFIENLTLTGSAANGTGNSLANVITGNGGANVLNGGAGADTLRGGAGSDTYFVDNVGDQIIEPGYAGTDTVNSSVNFTLGAYIENLTLTGSAANGTGNSLANVITGNGGANVLNGGAGADTMQGGAGSDTYFVDNVGDQVIDSSYAGTDTVNSSVSFMLGAFIENLTLTGSAANGTGNSLANVITGNGGANVLNGGAGADTMNGGAGNDAYYVDNSGDVILEASAGGIDAVASAISFTLGTHLENLSLLGMSVINGTGNASANRITGNGVANILIGAGGSDRLSGGAGNDRLEGGAGSDALTGGAGNDSFVFNYSLSASVNVDQIIDFSVTDDFMLLDQTIFTGISNTGTLGAAAFHTAASAHDADDRIIYDSATGRIYYDADGTGAQAQILFAQVAAGLALSNADFAIFHPAL